MNNYIFDRDQYYRDAGLSKNQQEIITHSNNWLRLHGKQACPRRIRKKIKHKIIQYNHERFFGIIEKTIDDIILDSFKNNEWFNQFVDVKDLRMKE